MSTPPKTYKETWKVACARVVGPSHLLGNVPCQDGFAYSVQGDRIVVAVADGAGSSARSEHGSRLLCATVVERLAAISEPIPRTNAATSVPIWGRAVWDAIEWVRENVVAEHAAAAALHNPALNVSPLLLAASESADTEHRESSPPSSDGSGAKPDPSDEPATPWTVSDYRSTLVGFVADRQGGFFFHLGDGHAVAVHDEETFADTTVSEPENGEYSNSTVFFDYSQWKRHVRFQVFPAATVVSAMTDGVAGFMFGADQKTLVAKIAKAITTGLRPANEAEASLGLQAFLERDAFKVNSDDKTLLWAMLAPPEPIPSWYIYVDSDDVEDVSSEPQSPASPEPPAPVTDSSTPPPLGMGVGWEDSHGE